MRARFEKITVEPTASVHVEERRLVRFDAPWHFHPEIELTLIVEGRGRRFVGDSIEPYAEGDLVLLGPNLPHFWHTEGRQARGARSHSIVVQFQREFLGEEFWTKPEIAPVNRLLERASRGLRFSAAISRGLLERMRALAKTQGLPALLELLAILHVLAHTRQARPLASAIYQPNLDRHAEQRLARVYTFLTQNFRESVSLAEVARVASMTPEAFSRYFKRTTGRNISIFINELRIDHAGRLLRETTRRVADIAAESGFVTLSSFNRRFRERMRCQPGEYRAAYVEETVSPVAFVATESDLPSVESYPTRKA